MEITIEQLKSLPGKLHISGLQIQGRRPFLPLFIGKDEALDEMAKAEGEKWVCDKIRDENWKVVVFTREWKAGWEHWPGDPEYDGDCPTLDIDLYINGEVEHGAAIRVHTTREDRDTIIAALNKSAA